MQNSEKQPIDSGFNLRESHVNPTLTTRLGKRKSRPGFGRLSGPGGDPGSGFGLFEPPDPEAREFRLEATEAEASRWCVKPSVIRQLKSGIGGYRRLSPCRLVVQHAFSLIHISVTMLDQIVGTFAICRI